jgi:hypothetical protein
MSKKLFLILILLPLFGFTQKDTIAHLHTFGGLANDVAEDIAITNDGGIVVIGSTASGGDGNTDIYLLKLDSACNYKWSYALGGTNNDWGYAIKQTFDNGFIIAASSNSYGNGGYDAILLKRDSLGNYQWQKTYGGNDWDFAYDVIQTFDSGYVFCGETYNNTAGFSDVYVVKTNSFGDTLWTKTVGGSLADRGNSLIQTSDSSIVVAGIRNTLTDSTQAYVLKFDKDGTLLWDVVFGGVKYDVANSIIESQDGAYVFVGTSDSFGTTNNDCFITKISTTGTLIWQNYFAMPQEDGAYDVVELTNGDILVAGYTSSFGGGRKDVLIFTVTSGGWWAAKNSTFGGLEDEIANGLAIDSHGNMYLSGYTNTYGEGLNDVMIIRVDTIVKQQQFTVTNNNDVAPISVQEIMKNELNITIFPNPANDYIEISTQQFPIQIQLIDASGKIIMDCVVRESTSKLQLKNISKGFYSLVFIDNGVVKNVQKLIILE